MNNCIIISEVIRHCLNCLFNLSSIRTFFKNYLSKTRVYFARTGQRYNIANVTVDVLFTPDDLDIGTAENNSSCYFKITVDNNQTIMITGDSEAKAAGYLATRYQAGGLASDIMQQAHHGYWAGSVDLYKLINPEVVWFPASSGEVKTMAQNAYASATDWIKCANYGVCREIERVKLIVTGGDCNTNNLGYNFTLTLTASGIDYENFYDAINHKVVETESELPQPGQGDGYVVLRPGK